MKFSVYRCSVNILQAKEIYSCNLKQYLYKIADEAAFKGKDKCPYCNSIKIIKYGSFGTNRQRYKCKNCERTFSTFTNSIFSHTKKNAREWIQYLHCMSEKYTIRESAREVKISNSTSFYWRHKILKVLKDSLPNNLRGIIEVKTAYISESYKGKRYPRQFDSNESKDYFAGIKSYKVCTVCCVDRSGGVFSKVLCRGSINYKSVEQMLKGRIPENSVLCIDNNMPYVAFAKRYRIPFYKMTFVSQIMNDKFHNRNAVQFMRSLKNLISRSRGVSTRYLNFYISWIKWLSVTRKDSRIKKMKNSFELIFNSKNSFRIQDLKTIAELG